MQRLLIATAALTLTAATLSAQGVLESIRTPDKAVATVNQTMEGTWLLELRRGGNAPAVLALMTFHPDGTVTGAAADGTQSTHHGVWVRVGDKRFLQTMYVFSYNETRALANIIKVRINAQLSPDGQTVRGTQEVVVMDRDGRVLATIPGGTYTGVRLGPEIPGDFYDFQ